MHKYRLPSSEQAYDVLRRMANTEKSLVRTRMLVEHILQRPMTMDEVRALISFTAGRPVEFYNDKRTLAEVQIALARNVANHINDQDDDEEDEFDVHEALKNEIRGNSFASQMEEHEPTEPSDPEAPNTQVTSFMGLHSLNDLLEILYPKSDPPPVPSVYPQITLDTRNRNLVDSDPGSRDTISWEFHQGVRMEQGCFTSQGGELKDIIGIEAGTIMMPNIFDALYHEYSQVSMFIREFSDQSCILTDKTRYHFLFNAELISGQDKIRLTPVFWECAFNNPITTVNTLTVSFAGPAERLSFGYDRDLNPTSIAADGTMQSLLLAITIMFRMVISFTSLAGPLATIKLTQ